MNQSPFLINNMVFSITYNRRNRENKCDNYVKNVTKEFRKIRKEH